MAKRQIGPFEIERQLGAGGMGIVYLATHLPTGKKVALKVLTPALSSDVKLLKRFEREIDILKRMSHPNIVKYYGGGTQDKQRYYAMEFIDGGSLQDVLKKRRRLTWEQAIQVGRQLCSALEHAHNAGIIHRDLKPANLFISRRGRLKLGDFGIARDTEATALTAAGKTVGTYAYMAPEQIHGNAPISRKTDLYATGCLLFETLTGETPFVGDNPAEMLMQHLNDYPRNVREVVSDCPIWLDELIERLLAKEPDERPHDALAVHTDLSNILVKIRESHVNATSPTVIGSGSTVHGGGIDPLAPEIKKKKKKKRKEYTQFYEQTWFLLCALAAVVGITVWLSLPPGEDEIFLLAKKGRDNVDESVQREAREKYMLPYLEQFPEGTHATQVREWAEQIQARVIEVQAEKRLKGDRPGDNDQEKALITAFKAERDEERHPLEAIELFGQLKNDLKNKPEYQSHKDARSLLIIADQHLEKCREALLKHPQRDKLIRDRLVAADRTLGDPAQAEQHEAAKNVLFYFREAFSGVREVEEYYTFARKRLFGEFAELPELKSGEVPAEAPGNP
jgi:serine/threonine-protein kinase